MSHTFKVMSKYVRRELRTLSDAEREKVTSAMKAIYEHDTSSGTTTFRSRKFKNIASFVTKHLIGSASKSCDAWHDDAGMMNHHSALSLEFEQAMQAVDPSVALPYWDFTLDYHNELVGNNWRASTIFSDVWFGPASSSRPDHAIDGSDWSLTRVLQVSNYIIFHFCVEPRYANLDNARTYTGGLPDC